MTTRSGNNGDMTREKENIPIRSAQVSRRSTRYWLVRWPTVCAAALGLVIAVSQSNEALGQRAQAAPEEATGWTDKPLATAKRYMVAAANPVAVEAGRAILRNGGNAIDAAIVTVLVLGIVEPQSSGLGGGAFLLFHDARAGKLFTYDGRETAPAAARPDRFMRDGQPIGFRDAVNSGLSVGVPGLARLLEMAHKSHGRLPWKDVVAPAIAIAREGFPVSARLNGLLGWYGAGRFSPQARAHYFDASGRPHPVGYVLRNEELARSLEALATEGAAPFYTGSIAGQIIEAVNGAARTAADMTLEDLAGYRVVARDPVCFAYRGQRICGMAPPSSGGLAVAQILKLISPFNEVQGKAAAMTPKAIHMIAEAEKLAYADRDYYVADPAFVGVPKGYLDDSYIDERRRLIDPARAMAKAEPGQPPGAFNTNNGADATRERGGTTHLSIIDADGNAVSMTATIEGAFGSGLWAGGFLLNNELTDFSFKPVDNTGRPIANRVEGGKRPRSSMAPTIVYGADGNVEAVLGAPGGHRIILYVVKALVGLLDWELDPQAVSALANFGDRGRGLEIEPGGGTAALALRLAARGHHMRLERMTSGLHIVARRNGQLEGGADPRREGVALGD